MVRVKFNSNIQYKRIDDCESGLSVDSQQQQESDSQVEVFGGKYPNPDIENMSPNETESHPIIICEWDQFKDGYTDGEQEDNTDDELSFYKSKRRIEDSNSRIWIIFIIFLFVCITTIIADNFGVHPERPIDHSYAFIYLAIVLSIIMSFILFELLC